MKRSWAMVLVAGVLLSGVALARGRSVAKVSGLVNINTATEKQLDSLPGVGPKQAKAIVVWRSKTPFSRIEEIVKVKGFGKKKFEKLKAHLAVGGTTTLAVGREAAPPSAQARPPPPAR